MVGLSLLHTFLNIDCCYVVRSEGSIYNNLIMEYLSILFGSFSNWKHGEFFSTYKGRCIYHFFQDLSWLSYGCLYALSCICPVPDFDILLLLKY
jgi:hypothetical protein